MSMPQIMMTRVRAAFSLVSHSSALCAAGQKIPITQLPVTARRLLHFSCNGTFSRKQKSVFIRTLSSGSFSSAKAGEGLPSSFRKIIVQRQSPNIDDALEIVSVPLQLPQNGEVLIKNRIVGINAADINICAGRYLVTGNPPYEIGFEGIGTVVAVGNDVSSLRIGQPVAYTIMKAYSEYVCVPAKEVLPIPEVRPEYVGLLVSGLTASISLDKKGRIKNGETVLITSAAGGAGHIAVQWAKHAGCHVIGLCSTPEKEEFLKDLKCDKVINYRNENIKDILKSQYGNGVDVVWETVGGKMFEDLFTKMANMGRLVCVGTITGYQSDQAVPRVDIGNLPEHLLFKSLSVCGFFLPHYTEEFSAYLGKLITMMKQGNLKVYLDGGKKTSEGEFTGLEGVIRAIKHLHSGKNIGKVIARLS